MAKTKAETVTPETAPAPTNGESTKRARFTVQWAQKVLPNDGEAPMAVGSILVGPEHKTDGEANKWLGENAAKGYRYKLMRHTGVELVAQAQTGVELVPA